MTVVSIRTKNPGAMWPNAIATQFGSTTFEQLNDAQRNKAAIFPTFEQGGAAQFALWAKKYAGMRLSQAIYMWSGHNSSPAYALFLQAHVPGLTMDTVLSADFFKSPTACKFMAAQAQWEAGQPYPMTEAQWQKAQQIAFGGAAVPRKTVRPHKSLAGGAAAGAAAHASGASPWIVVAVALSVALAIYLYERNKK